MLKKAILVLVFIVIFLVWLWVIAYVTTDKDSQEFIRNDVNPFSKFGSSVCTYMDSQYWDEFEAQCWTLVVHFAYSPSRYQEYKSEVTSYLDSQELKYRVIQDSDKLVSFGFQLKQDINQDNLEEIKNDLKNIKAVKHVFYNRTVDFDNVFDW